MTNHHKSLAALYVVTWIVALWATCQQPAFVIWAWMFPLGLFRIDDINWYGILAGWGIYLIHGIFFIRARKLATKVIAYVVLVTLLVFNVIGCRKTFDNFADSKVRYDTPLTYGEATRKDLGFPFPQSARNINYAMYADFQAYQRLVRFEAPVADCVKQIDVVLAWHNQMMKWGPPDYPRRNVSAVSPHGGDSQMGPTPWYDVDRIQHGIYAGQEGSHTPQVWVDTDRGVFYYYATD